MVLLSRAAVFVLVVLAVLLSIKAKEVVFWFVLFAWAGLGAAIGPTSILALFWKKTTKIGVAAGLVVGTGTVFYWRLNSYLHDLIYELIPAFILALLVTVVVSLVTQQENTRSKDDVIDDPEE